MTKKNTQDRPEKEEIAQSLDQLEKIVAWFDAQESVQVQEGLAKVRQGVGLIKTLRERLKEVENEFQELKKDLAEPEES